eukprot:196405-Rhodomonas_salina.1
MDPDSRRNRRLGLLWRLLLLLLRLDQPDNNRPQHSVTEPAPERQEQHCYQHHHHHHHHHHHVSTRKRTTPCQLPSDSTMLSAPKTPASAHIIASHHITSHHITSHRIASHHITSHHITSHHITSHHITSHRITSHHIRGSGTHLGLVL